MMPTADLIVRPLNVTTIAAWRHFSGIPGGAVRGLCLFVVTLPFSQPFMMMVTFRHLFQR